MCPSNRSEQPFGHKIASGFLFLRFLRLFAAQNALLPCRATEQASHQLELEVGYTQAKEAGLDADLLPVTLNYRLQAAGRGKFGYYAGLGAGFARTAIDGVSIFGPVRLRNTSFAAQGRSLGEDLSPMWKSATTFRRASSDWNEPFTA